MSGVSQKAVELADVLGPAGADIPARPKRSALLYIIEGEIAAGKTELCKAIAEHLRGLGLNVCLVLEPVDEWKQVGIFDKFYADPARFGYAFQTYVFATRVKAIALEVAANPDADVFLLERSPATDTIFMELQRGLVDATETVMYEMWCDSWKFMLPVDISRGRVLYLKTSIEHCMERLARRKREGEILAAADPEAVDHGTPSLSQSQALSRSQSLPPPSSAKGGVSIAYQLRLRRAHEAFLLGLHPEEFPHLPKSPFPRASIIEIEPRLADGNFLDRGGERDAIVSAIVRKMGLSD